MGYELCATLIASGGISNPYGEPKLVAVSRSPSVVSSLRVQRDIGAPLRPCTWRLIPDSLSPGTLQLRVEACPRMGTGSKLKALDCTATSFGSSSPSRCASRLAISTEPPPSYFDVTNSVATSPTICSDRAETLSIVSPCV
jgi:hypothetical protein